MATYYGTSGADYYNYTGSEQLYAYGYGGIDILAAVKRTAIPKPHDLGFCFFPEGFFAPALTDLLCSGLMVALQTD
ncbi:MAG: hypothetical protein ACK5U2_07435, partial [Microcystis sp.]|nr:hypothetical protein [Microcystis sp. LE18-22.4A]MCZ8250443.1 hypothetical protein [Microcystis sp. LE19-195.1E]